MIRDPNGSEGAARSLAEYAIRVIREQLLSGRLAPGSRIQAEQLAASLEMSPSPIGPMSSPTVVKASGAVMIVVLSRSETSP